jgi:hypothetical protein
MGGTWQNQPYLNCDTEVNEYLSSNLNTKCCNTLEDSQDVLVDVNRKILGDRR